MAHNTEKLRELLERLRELSDRLDSFVGDDTEWDSGYESGQSYSANEIRALISQAEGEGA